MPTMALAPSLVVLEPGEPVPYRVLRDSIMEYQRREASRVGALPTCGGTEVESLLPPEFRAKLIKGGQKWGKLLSQVGEVTTT